MPEISTPEREADQSAPTCSANWWNSEHAPEYKFHFQGTPTVNIIIALKDGSVWPGDYTDGKWCVLGVEVPKERVGAWCLYPESPKF